MHARDVRDLEGEISSLRAHSKVFENRIGPKALHVTLREWVKKKVCDSSNVEAHPVLHLFMPRWVTFSSDSASRRLTNIFTGPIATERASPPMRKSNSAVSVSQKKIL